MHWMRAISRLRGRLPVVGCRLSAAGPTQVRGGWAIQAAAFASALALALGFDLASAADNRQPTTDNPGTAAATTKPAGDRARTPDLLATIGARIQPAAVLRGEFVQERTLAGFARPLRSSGRFVAARGRGVLWVTLAPFPGELVITEDAIRERVDGSESVVVDASREPALQQVNRVLLALLQGDLATLAEQFNVAGEDSPKRWQLLLTPRGQVAELIGRIELSGDTQVESVVIHERNGDASRIAFSGLRTAQALSPEDSARFD